MTHMFFNPNDNLNMNTSEREMRFILSLECDKCSVVRAQQTEVRMKTVFIGIK